MPTVQGEAQVLPVVSYVWNLYVIGFYVKINVAMELVCFCFRSSFILTSLYHDRLNNGTFLAKMIKWNTPG